MGVKLSMLSPVGCTWFSVSILRVVVQLHTHTNDSTIGTIVGMRNVVFLLLGIPPRSVDDYGRGRRLILRGSVNHGASCGCSSIAGIPLHEFLVIILPLGTVSKLVDTVVNRLTRRSIEATRVVAHDRIFGRSPYAAPVGETTLKDS